MERAEIVSEIKRLAEANGGKPLGRDRFFAATGIRPADVDRYWVRWNDALVDAGFERNTFQARHDDDTVLTQLAELVRDLGHFPVKNELRQRSQVGPSFPNDKTLLGRYGGKAGLVAKLAEYTADRPEWRDVAVICSEAIPPSPSDQATPVVADSAVVGYVYLMKSGRNFKIGHTNSVGRRAYEVGLLLPEALRLVHQIETDDPAGIEAYWHRRFADRRTRGEWFKLTPEEVAAFRRRRYM